MGPLDSSYAKPKTVLVVDDSAFFRVAVTRMIESDPGFQVVGAAKDGIAALEKILELDPDLITLDLNMPRLDGLEVLRRLPRGKARRVVVLSGLTREGAEITLSALELGAFDCVAKSPDDKSAGIESVRDELLEKLRAAAESHSATEPYGRRDSMTVRIPAQAVAGSSRAPALVIIGTSTGGPKALQEIIPRLPADLPSGVLIVQHMPKGFTGPFAQRLNSISPICVREAADEDAIQPGLVLIAPAAWHCIIARDSARGFIVRLTKSPIDTLHVPSVDVTMLSAAEICGADAMGVILTGMGTDGAEGMKAIYEIGGYTVGQDEATCAVYGMPRACAELGILRRQVPLKKIAEEIVAAALPVANMSRESA